MTQYFDNLEVRDPEVRTNSQFTLLPGLIRRAKSFPGWAEQLKYISPEEITSWDALGNAAGVAKIGTVGFAETAAAAGWICFPRGRRYFKTVRKSGTDI